jgi:hypothetical protein
MANILVFHGADYKVGTTMIAQSVSEVLAKKYADCKVLRIAMNNRRSCDFIKEAIPSLEGFKKSLETGAVIGEQLFRRYHIRDNLYGISGLEKEFNHRQYFPEDAYKILKPLERQFDFIVVDGGCDIDNGLVLGSLTMGAINILVVTQDESAISRWEQQEPIYQGFAIHFDSLIVNKYQNSHPYSLSYIAERLDLKLQSKNKIKFSSYGYQAEWEKKTLLQYGINSYKNQILEIIKHLRIKPVFKGKEGVQ